MRIKRSDFDNHMQNVCPKADVICLAADIMCQWEGQREELNDHMRLCEFQRMRPLLDQLIMENEHLKEQIKQTSEQNQELSNNVIEIQQVRSRLQQLLAENKQLREQLTRVRAQNDELMNNTREGNGEFILKMHKPAPII
jgi:chromosome segregation ATPase